MGLVVMLPRRRLLSAITKLKGQAERESQGSTTNTVNMDLLMERLRDGTIGQHEISAQMEAARKVNGPSRRQGNKAAPSRGSFNLSTEGLGFFEEGEPGRREGPSFGGGATGCDDRSHVYREAGAWGQGWSTAVDHVARVAFPVLFLFVLALK